MQKKYKKWAKMKSIIEKFRKPRYFTPWDIIWAYIWTNIGHEICWHGDGITRPVLVLKRFWTIHTVLPMTSSWFFKDDNWRWVLKSYHHKITSITFGKYNKASGKMIPYNSCVVYNRLSSLDSKRFNEIPKDINWSYAKLSNKELLEIKNKVIHELSR